MDTQALDNDTRLKWVVGGDDVAGYEVLWRATTESEWRNVVSVGKVGSVRLELSKDNAIFGVRSVGSNGYRSPAVFPFPA